MSGHCSSASGMTFPHDIFFMDSKIHRAIAAISARDKTACSDRNNCLEQIVRVRLNISGLEQYSADATFSVPRCDRKSPSRIEAHDASSRLIERGHSSMK